MDVKIISNLWRWFRMKLIKEESEQEVEFQPVDVHLRLESKAELQAVNRLANFSKSIPLALQEKKGKTGDKGISDIQAQIMKNALDIIYDGTKRIV